jgi:hypothetical protein
MTSRRILAVLAAAVACVGLSFSGHTAAQPPANPAAQGRYQMHVVGRPNSSTVFVLDTHTGQTWYRETAYEVKSWTDMGSPVAPEKKGP